LLETLPGGLPLFVGLAAVGQLSYVWVRHGSTNEELTFFEVVLAAAILVLAPATAFGATLGGMLIGELIIRRPPIKLAYNLGSYAAATGAMVITYNVIFPPGPESADPFTWNSILALLCAAIVFTVVNTATLASLMHAAMGAEPREFIREEWQLSGFMAVGSVGIGAMGVALAANPDTRALVPFVLLPALALWYAYGAAAQHSEARERNRWLVTLGAALARQGQAEGLLVQAGEAIRQIVGAPELTIVLPPTGGRPDPRAQVLLASLEANQDPRPLHPVELPPGWASGIVVPLELGPDGRGAFLLGATVPYRRGRIPTRTRGWTLEEADAPVLGALVAAVGSAMRAGAAFSALTEEKQKLTAVVDNTSDGIAMVDDAGQVRLWSQTMARMTGVDAGALEGSAGRVPTIVRTVIEASRDGQAASDRTPVQVHLVRGDGEELDVSISTVRVRESVASGSPEDAGWVSILTVHDETRERRVARMKSDFMATISHELRTPITPIKGYAHLLSTRGQRITPEKQAQALDVIVQSANRMERLVEDLLRATKDSETSRLAVKLGIEPLDDLVGKAVSGFPAMSDRITVSLPAGALLVRCDGDRVVQCLSNLIGNAEKYTDSDSPVDIDARVVGPNVQIHVRDHGPGIPASEQEKVFERFYRREDPLTMRTGGAGLGLHIARELALAMGGGLTVQTPTAGPGVEFVLHLPVATQAEIDDAAQAPDPEELPGYRPDPRKQPGSGSGPTAHPGATMSMPSTQRAAAT
jgi:PAS domain S-box-containing protein